jgi:hypothetical protein
MNPLPIEDSSESAEVSRGRLQKTHLPYQKGSVYHSCDGGQLFSNIPCPLSFLVIKSPELQLHLCLSIEWLSFLVSFQTECELSKPSTLSSVHFLYNLFYNLKHAEAIGIEIFLLPTIFFFPPPSYASFPPSFPFSFPSSFKGCHLEEQNE